MATKRAIVAGGIDEYISKCPEDVQDSLKKIRAAISEVVPDATETLSYFQFPGYHYEGNYAYNGMFAWFSYKAPFIRLHVYPEVIKNNKKELEEYPKATGAVSFPQEKKLPISLVKKLVLESLEVMKNKPTSKQISQTLDERSNK